MLSAFMLNIVILSVIMLSIVMLSLYTECSYIEYRYAECRNAQCLYAEYSCTKCRYAESRKAKCRGVTTALSLMTYSIMTISIKDLFETLSISEINFTKFDPRMSMFRLSRWLYHEKFMFCFYFGTVCGANMFALAHFLQPEQVACIAHILRSSHDNHHERHLYYKCVLALTNVVNYGSKCDGRI